MHVLFVVGRLAHVRHFDRAIRLLADRGHTITLGSQDDDLELRGVLAQHPRIRAIAAPRNRTDDWAPHATAVRRARDFVRYLHPRYAQARPLRSRAFEQMVHAIGPTRDVPDGWSEALLGVSKKEQRHLDMLFRKLETAVPFDAGIHAFIQALRPDALVLSPMVGIGFSQADFVKSARALGIPSAMLVFSWDNLSNKGLIHEPPDRMLVWNQVQAREAFKLHKYPKEQVVITGAPRFDEMFEMTAATTREQFCELIGADPGKPMISYLCSSKFVADVERQFTVRWISELRRGGDQNLAGCTIVIRPHPTVWRDWLSRDAGDFRWPGTDADKVTVSRPFDDAGTRVLYSPMQNASQVLYDTVYHSAAVVGLNTSAEIEAAIIGRPVYTILDPDAAGQRGTLHFDYLLQSHGGHVQFADSFDAHRAQLSDALAGRADLGATHAFVRRFVRPLGVDRPVAPILAEAIEDVARPYFDSPSSRVSAPAG